MSKSIHDNKKRIQVLSSIIFNLIVFILFLFTVPQSVYAVNTVTNGTFDSNINGWAADINTLEGTRALDNSVFGVSAGSMGYITNTGRRQEVRLSDSTLLTQTINNTDSVFLSFYHYKYAAVSNASRSDIYVYLTEQGTTNRIELWSELTRPTSGQTLDGNVTDLDVTSLVTTTATYYLTVDVRIQSGTNNGSFTQFNIDDIVLDVVTPTVNQPPVVTDIPNQTIAEGSSFTTINLDDFVSDPDNTDAEMTWSYTGNTELTVDITNRVATITTPNSDWFGAETITFRATDPGTLWDEDAATFTVTNQNDPPVVTDIPNQTVLEGASFTTINLDDYVSDIDNTDAEMTWSYSGNTELTVDITARVATITIPNTDWNGAETITFRATDPGTLWDEDAATFTVTAQNDPPVVTDIPNQSIAEGATFTTINLDDYVSDIDNTDAEMTWSYSGNTELTVDITARVATITIPNTDWFGSEVITFRATDPGLLWDEDAATFTVTNQNDPPVVIDIPNQTVLEGASFTTINLDDYVSDIDNTDAEMVWTFSGNTELTVDITNRVATITIPDTDWNGAETITFRATDPGLLWDEDAATFTVTAQNDPPVVTDIPNQTIPEGNSFTTINLDDYVSDVDNIDSEMTWTYSGNTELTVDITNRVATVTTPSPTWQGSEVITFRATDPGLLWDEDAATFTVTPQNDPPVVSDIPNQTIAEGASFTTITLDSYVSDPDNADNEIVWTYSGNTEITVDITNRIATITTPNQDWNGAEVITFRATDPGTLWDEDAATFTVTAENDPPVVADIPNQSVSEGNTFATVNLDDYVTDVDNLDSEMNWTYSGNTELTVFIDVNRIATITIPSIEWAGSEVITFRATDPGTLWDEDAATFTVTAQNDPPVVIGIPDQTISEGSTFTTITLDDYVSDIDNTDAEMTWTYSGNSELTVDITNRIATITIPDTDWFGAETITFRATDPGLLWDDDAALFTVTNLNDQPTLTNGVTAVSVSPVNRAGNNITVLSATFQDIDEPGIGAFTCTFKIREPDNSTELILVNDLSNGTGGLTIVDNGNGSYTASYSYNPSAVQTVGLYDLYFEVSDGIAAAAVDDYNTNLDELEIIEILANNAPSVTAGASQMSVSPLSRLGGNTTDFSATFTDSDQPGINSFTVIMKIREPNNSSEVVLVNDHPNGTGGLTIVDNGGGSYTASYTYDPADVQTLGLYDLYFEVSDGTDNAIDGYTNNIDEFEIIEVIPNNPPITTAGNVRTSTTQVNRWGNNTTTIYSTFSDNDQPAVGSFFVTFKIREPNNSTELILVNNEQDGLGGLSVIDLGFGNYRAEYDYNPDDVQTLGFYDLFFEVTDGTDLATDAYTDNLDELEMIEVISNIVPTMAVSATTALPSSIDRAGGTTTTISTTFSDNDAAGINTFFVTFQVRSPFNEFTQTLVSNSQHGQNGVTVTDNGGGSYTASYDWNPVDNIQLGYYDLYAVISDGQDSDTDFFDDNNDELLINNGGENAAPVVSSDAAYANPFGIERIGANVTTIGAQFVDADLPGVNAFTISIKLRDPDNSTEINLVNSATNGNQGLTVTDEGSGIYRGVVDWDPPDAQNLGFYDIYFMVTDGADTSIDNFSNNNDELEVFDAISNNNPTIVSGNTSVSPVSVNRIGTEFVTILSDFADVDMPGTGAFTVTISVRDQSLTEYTIVNAAKHGEQGLRIRHISGANYQASVLWDPPESQITGTYDLSISIQDNHLASISDGYSNNADELTISSAALLGDGRLLKRNHNANNCGGAAAACHDMVDHQGQDCLVCHTPHSTTNIYLIRETITTPNSGDKSVIFKTLGIGDPYNDPDPSPGDPNSGVMADETDGVFTGVCEVCHTTAGHHRNDGSQPPPNHHDAQDCTGCHPHSDGFANSGGGESSGGDGCSCHSSFGNAMNSSSTSFHHQIDSENADYNVNSKTCLMCHVNHDIFRPDLNTGFGSRAANLRVDITTSVVQGSSSVLANYDYTSSGTGGICLSCHTSAQTKSYSPPDGSSSTVAIDKTEFDGSDAHNYFVTSTFSTDGSSFNANCVKCHNDNKNKSYQNSTNKFGTHDSDFGRLLDTLGQASMTDPLEEDHCLGCHSGSSGSDYYGSQSMTTASQNIAVSLTRTYAHPTTTYSGRHDGSEGPAGLGDGNRHAECVDCHNPHAAKKGTHDGSSTLVSGALTGVWGVEPTSWPARQTASDNANVFTAPVSYTVVNPAQHEYQICLKCHSNYTTLPTGSRNIAEEINPNYPSTHGITVANQNSFCNSTTMFEPWGSSGSTYCSDCHRSSISSDPEGPHGSNAEHLLVASVVSDDVSGTPLCNVCHRPTVYWDGSAASSRYDQHPATKGAHQLAQGCFACHMWDYSSTSGLGVPTTSWSGGNPNFKIFVHGQNKDWNFNEQDGSGGSGQPVDAFVNGMLANIDYTNRQCWAEVCKSHSGTGY